MILHRFSGIANGYAYEAWLNGEPTSHYYGTFANNYTYKSLGEYLVQPPIWHIAVGQYSTGFLMSSPPLGTQAGTIVGGAVISVGCGTDTLSKTVVDLPCLHGINPQYDLFRNGPGATAKRMNIFVNSATGTMGIGEQSVTWRAPTLTAYDPVTATANVALLGTGNGVLEGAPASDSTFWIRIRIICRQTDASADFSMLSADHSETCSSRLTMGMAQRVTPQHSA
jgi:hypothetical protein